MTDQTFPQLKATLSDRIKSLREQIDTVDVDVPVRSHDTRQLMNIVADICATVELQARFDADTHERLKMLEIGSNTLQKLYVEVLKREQALESPAAPQVAGGVEEELAELAKRTSESVARYPAMCLAKEALALCNAVGQLQQQLTVAREALSIQGQNLGDVIVRENEMRQSVERAHEELRKCGVGAYVDLADGIGQLVALGPTPPAPSGTDREAEELRELARYIRLSRGSDAVDAQMLDRVAATLTRLSLAETKAVES